MIKVRLRESDLTRNGEAPSREERRTESPLQKVRTIWRASVAAAATAGVAEPRKDSVMGIEAAMKAAHTATSGKLFSASSGFSLKAEARITAKERVESAALSRRSVTAN